MNCSYYIQERIEKEKIDYIKGLLKITFPLVFQNVIAETVGTTKLSKILEELLEEDNVSNDSFIMFMYVFLYSDLKLPKFIDVISRFVKGTQSRDLLTLSVFKLFFYYQFGHVNPSQENEVVTLIADSIIRIKKLNKLVKGRIISAIRDQNFNPKKILLGR